MAPLVRTGGSRHTGLAAPPHRNIQKAVPYVVLSNQLIALAWFEGKEKYQETYEINKKMTEWLVSVWSELSVE